MKKLAKVLLSSVIALAMFLISIQVQPVHNKEKKTNSISISINNTNAEAKGLFSIFKPKTKSKPKQKPKKKTETQLYNNAKKKGIKTKKHSAYHKGKLPTTGQKYSSKDLYKDGKLNTRRYYGKSGKADIDIHYTNHGNPKKHPKVPHRHKWGYDSKGKWTPGKGY
ncbi:hypothetical protein [Kurthia gibsonii]|uniref:hypothetical protein n=1 Tax=Kurthia gibsonii TaxID=33946 RepID=UPI00301A6C2D